VTTSRTRKTTSGGSEASEEATSPPKKAAPRKRAPAKKVDSDSDSGGSAPRKRASAPRTEARPKANASQVALEAARQLLELTGKAAEGVTSLQRTDDGWQVQVEVVEVRRIPDTTDVLAIYELDVDEQGALQGYHRLRRYTRGVPGES
jgi:hypothetical protein